jgi:hypothetical protein
VSELRDAVDVVVRRGQAALGRDERGAVDLADRGFGGRLLVGTDIDPVEAGRLASERGRIALSAMALGGATPDAMMGAAAGAWLQGLVTGVVLEQRRHQPKPAAGAGDPRLDRVLADVRAELEHGVQELRRKVQAGEVCLDEAARRGLEVYVTAAVTPSGLRARGYGHRKRRRP